MKACNEQGIRLLTIFEDEWLNTPDIVKAKIANIVGQSSSKPVYARKTVVASVTTKNRKQFLNANHIQGDGPGSITYGLYYNKTLVGVMTFRKRSQLVYELNRYATSTNVPGGFSKLLKHFTRNHEWSELISFADLRWSCGDLYENTGWTLDGIVKPDYYWCKGGQRHHKFAFRHSNLPRKLETYDPTLSENENCKNNGYAKIYNCGLKRYVKIKNDT